MEALKAYRDNLSGQIEGYQRTLDAMKAGHQKTYERADSGEMTDLTPARITDFEAIIATLNQTLRDIDIKLGIIKQV